MAGSALEELGRKIAAHLGIGPSEPEAPGMPSPPEQAPPAGFAQPPPPPLEDPPTMPSPPSPPSPPPVPRETRQAPISGETIAPKIRRQAPAQPPTRYADKPRLQIGPYDDPTQPRPAFLSDDQTNIIAPPNLGSSPGAAGARRLTVEEARRAFNKKPVAAPTPSAAAPTPEDPYKYLSNGFVGPPRSAMMPDGEMNPAGNMVQADQAAYAPRLADDSRLSGVNGGMYALDRTQQILGTRSAPDRRQDTQHPRYMGIDLSRYFRTNPRAGKLARLAELVNQPLAQQASLENQALRAEEIDINRQKLAAKGEGSWASTGMLSDDGRLVLLDKAGRTMLGPKVQPKTNPMAELTAELARDRLKLDQSKVNQGTLTKPQDGPQGYGVYRIFPDTGSGPPQPPRLELPLEKPPKASRSAQPKTLPPIKKADGKYYNRYRDADGNITVDDVPTSPPAGERIAAEALEKKRINYSKELRSTGIVDTYSALRELQDVVSKYPKELPGYDIRSNTIRDMRGAFDENIRELKRAVAKLSNQQIHEFAGATQTRTELNKILAELGQTEFASQKDLLSAMREIDKLMRDQIKNLNSGYGRSVVQDYVENENGMDYANSRPFNHPLLPPEQPEQPAPEAPAAPAGVAQPPPAPQPAAPPKKLPDQTIEQKRQAPRRRTLSEERELQELKKVGKP